LRRMYIILLVLIDLKTSRMRIPVDFIRKMLGAGLGEAFLV
jgi:hypothetical protein